MYITQTACLELEVICLVGFGGVYVSACTVQIARISEVQAGGNDNEA